MTWSEAKAKAAELMKALRAQFSEPEIRLIIRALGRLHQTAKKPTMNTPQIIVAEKAPGKYSVSVSGRFGGGFQNLQLDRAGVISRLSYLKSFDCGEEPAAVVVPESLAAEFKKVFPNSLP
jgi:hypothetical protein